MATSAKGRDPDEISDAIVAASRALLEVSMNVLASAAPELNLGDLQVLTMLDRLGPQRLIDIAEALDVSPTTATRIADRLTEQHMVERVRQREDRREIRLGLSALGADLVGAVDRRRRRVVASRTKSVSIAEQSAAMNLLSRIAGSGPYPKAESA